MEQEIKHSYRETFREIHVPEALSERVMNISESGKKCTSFYVKRWAAAMLALVILLVGSNGIAYAATGKLWLETVIVHFNGASYQVDMKEQTDEDGNVYYSGITDMYEDGPTAVFAAGKMADADGTADIVMEEFHSVEALAEYAPALVKVEVTGAESAHVRSYIYTSYEVRILDTVYGDVGRDGDIICVNMPGGIIRGDAAKEMITENTAGKDSGDLSSVNELTSNGNTDRLLMIGDVAYLFLVRESDTAYAAAGEYRGELLVDDGEVVFDSGITRFEENSALEIVNGRMEEDEFLRNIYKVIH